MSKKYIHYGHSKFDPIYVRYEVHPLACKPNMGLWASPVDTDWGWKDWCESEQWSCSDMNLHFYFTLSDSAKIFEVHSEDDILPYLISTGTPTFTKTSIGDGIDFDRIFREGYDGMELFISEDYSMHDGVFNVWDCDSIVVWNPDVIQEVEG